MNKNHLVFLCLLLILSAVLIGGFINQSGQTNKKEAIKTLVIDAANLIATDGEHSFSELRQHGTKWYQDETYVFVWKTDGLRLVYPPDRNGEGQNMSSLVDVTGKPIGKLFIDIALSEDGEGWVDYQWPKPEETEPSTKQTYIKGIQMDGEVLLVGSGLYAQSSEDVITPLQYVAIVVEGVIAAFGLLIAVHKKRSIGLGIFLTFIIYVFYDLARVTSIELSDAVLYPVFFVATLSMLWVVILLYKEKVQQPPK